MSTCNYCTTLNGAPLVVFEGEPEDELAEYQNATIAAQNKNAGLAWYNIEVKGGYYTGIQFNIILTEAGEYAEGLAEDGDDDTAREWYDLTAAQLAEEMQKERASAERWIRGWTRYGWRELALVGVFSNGEGVYREISAA